MQIYDSILQDTRQHTASFPKEAGGIFILVR